MQFYRNTEVAPITINCIRLRQNIEYIKGKIYEHRPWLKLENLQQFLVNLLNKIQQPVIRRLLINMGRIQRYALTNTFSVKQAKKRSLDCQIYPTPEAKQVKMVHDFPHLCQFILVQPCNTKSIATKYLTNVFLVLK